MEEMRAHKRASVNIKVAYRDNGFAYKMGRVINISRGGMYITTDTPPDNVDGYIIASLDVEEFGKIIWTHGRIIRKTDKGMAVTFTRIDGKGLDLLLSYQGVPY
ncbi:MAG TPA: PilZ domain-containing protein [Deltaproteobacteria bacterium]|jgi:hypothetical protein|nr:PilZ domain-containing protein [Deltaproteobacteria bacterium]